jgi:uncharacterized peroxidase-related enzyme
MERIPALDPASATGRAKELLDATAKQLGRVPNLYRAMAQSPAALDGYLAFRASLGKGVLGVRMREQIALLTAAMNDCGYCVAAHTFRGEKIGMSETELAATMKAHADSERDSAALGFVQKLIWQNGRIEDADFSKLKTAGWSHEEVGEMVGHVALNVFSNYFNHVAKPELDFPPVPATR